MIKHEDESEPQGPSKSQLKREMHALQDLGLKLTEFSQDMLAKCSLPSRLLEALEDYQRLPNKHGARRRQLQFIGKLMRELDEEALQSIEQQLNQNVDLEKKRFHMLEQQRDRLLSGDADALTELVAAHPEVEVQALRQLIRQAGKEARENKPPASARKLFRLLRELQQDQ